MTFKEKFEKKVAEYWELCSDCEDLEAFAEELTITTKEKSFRIQNPIMWKAINANRNQLFIGIVEWIDSIALGQGNFLNDVMGNHLKEVRILSKRQKKNFQPLNKGSDVDEVISSHHQRHIDALMSNFFGPCRQFPKKHQTRLCNCDVETLGNKFVSIRDRLAIARHMSAHPYSEIENVNNLSLKDVRISIDLIKEYLDIISSISNIGIALEPPNRSYCLEAGNLARDIVDQILCGSIQQLPFLAQNIETPYHRSLKQNREEFYIKLHRFHDDEVDKNLNYKSMFNDHDSMYFQFSKMHNGLFGKIQEAL